MARIKKKYNRSKSVVALQTFEYVLFISFSKKKYSFHISYLPVLWWCASQTSSLVALHSLLPHPWKAPPFSPSRLLLLQLPPPRWSPPPPPAPCQAPWRGAPIEAPWSREWCPEWRKHSVNTSKCTWKGSPPPPPHKKEIGLVSLFCFSSISCTNVQNTWVVHTRWFKKKNPRQQNYL